MEKLERLRDLTREELLQKITENKGELFNLRISRSTKDLDNPIRLRALRREIAKIKTLLREDELKIRGLAEEQSPIGSRPPEKEKRS
jgi:large subunit ribosomal protein L29